MVGESGCGKTTTANLILGLIRPTSGRVVVAGDDLAVLDKDAMRAKRRRLQMIFQDPYESLNPRMRVSDIVAEPLRVHKVATEPCRRAPPGGEGAGPGGAEPTGCLLGSPSPPVVGWAETAGGHRRRPRPRTAGPHRRRAGVDARCLHPGRDPQPARPARIRAGHRRAHDHPRPLDGGRLQPPGGGDVPGPGGGDRAHYGGADSTPPPVHRGAPVGGPGPGPCPEDPAHRARRRDPRPVTDRSRMPVPPPVSPRLRPVPHRRSPARGGGHRPPRRLSAQQPVAIDDPPEDPPTGRRDRRPPHRRATTPSPTSPECGWDTPR